MVKLNESSFMDTGFIGRSTGAVCGSCKCAEYLYDLEEKVTTVKGHTLSYFDEVCVCPACKHTVVTKRQQKENQENIERLCDKMYCEIEIKNKKDKEAINRGTVFLGGVITLIVVLYSLGCFN